MASAILLPVSLGKNNSRKTRKVLNYSGTHGARLCLIIAVFRRRRRVVLFFFQVQTEICVDICSLSDGCCHFFPYFPATWPWVRYTTVQQIRAVDNDESWRVVNHFLFLTFKSVAGTHKFPPLTAAWLLSELVCFNVWASVGTHRSKRRAPSWNEMFVMSRPAKVKTNNENVPTFSSTGRRCETNIPSVKEIFYIPSFCCVFLSADCSKREWTSWAPIWLRFTRVRLPFTSTLQPTACFFFLSSKSLLLLLSPSRVDDFLIPPFTGIP